MIDEPDAEPRGRHTVAAKGRFDPELAADPEGEPGTLERAVGGFEKGGETERRKRTAVEPCAGDGFEIAPPDHAPRRAPADRDKALEMAHHPAGKAEQRTHQRHRITTPSKVRAGAQRHRVVVRGERQFGTIEAMFEHRERAFRTGRKTRQVEGQAIAQKLEPELLTRPHRIPMGTLRGAGIVADVGCGPCSRESLDPMAIRPAAFGKQQVQLGIKGALRL
jgi:hypothetical protein